MTDRPTTIAAAAIVLAALGGAPAQSARDADPDREPAVTASLVPVGSNSDAYWVGDGPGIRAIPLDPGAAPPKTLHVRRRGGLEGIPTILNRPSPAIPVAGGLLRVFASGEAAADADPPLFGEFRLPAAPGHYDVFLNRAGRRDDWTDAESLVLPSSTRSFPPGSFRLVNLCREPVRVRLGSETIDLGPRRAQVVRAAAGTAGRLVQVQGLRAAGDGVQWILRTGIRIGPGQRANLLFYPGRDAKNPCKATWYHQPDPQPAPEEKPAG